MSETETESSSFLEKLPKYKDRAKSMGKKALVGGLIAAGLASPLGNSYSTLAQDKSPFNTDDRPVAEKQLKSPNQFWIDNFDGYPGVEGVFAYNQTLAKFEITSDQNTSNKDYEVEKNSLIAAYPFKGEDGKIYNNLIKIPGHVVEIKSGNVDEDDQEEFGIFTNTSKSKDNAAYIGDFENSNLDTEKYAVESDKEIFDGQLVDESPVISVDEEIDPERGQFGVYKFDNEEWKPFEYNDFGIEELFYHIEETQGRMPFHVYNILCDDINQDGRVDFLMDYKFEDEEGFHTVAWSTDGKYETVFERNKVWGISEDISIGNTNPWLNKEESLIMTHEGSLTRVPLKTNKMKGEEGISFWPEARWYKSDIKANDSVLVPYRKMLPEGAREAEGSREWVNYWKEKYGAILPYLISAEDIGLLMGGKEFKSPLFPPFIDHNNFSEYLEESEIVRID